MTFWCLSILFPLSYKYFGSTFGASDAVQVASNVSGFSGAFIYMIDGHQLANRILLAHSCSTWSMGHHENHLPNTNSLYENSPFVFFHSIGDICRSGVKKGKKKKKKSCHENSPIEAIIVHKKANYATVVQKHLQWELLMLHKCITRRLNESANYSTPIYIYICIFVLAGGIVKIIYAI